MSDTQHTPGPWAMGEYTTTPRMVRLLTDGPQVCVNRSDGTLVALCGLAGDGNSVADARLIAAAPALLAALEALYGSSRCEPVGKDGKDCWLVSAEALAAAWRVIRAAKG